jgi:hypothetical protein
MKKTLLLTALIILSINAFSQIGVDVNNQMETTIDYKLNRFRFGASFDPNQNNLSMIMPAFKYEIIQKEDYNMYFGVTVVDLEFISGVRIPVGVNIFPFTTKNFGLMMEVYGSYGTEYEWDQPDGYDNRFFVRGVVGFTYRF